MINVNGQNIELNTFPDGSLRLELEIQERSTIMWCYEPNEELALYFIARHLKDHGVSTTLYMPYVPNARMDRTKGNQIFTLKYFAEFINSLDFHKVFIKDPHSAVCCELFNNLHVIPVIDDINYLISKLLTNNDIIFFPDEGSKKRYLELDFEYSFAIKKRDSTTGKIESLKIAKPVPTRPFNVLIIDDICSYGNTFLQVAKLLKQAGAKNIYLYVTHCENSILSGPLLESGLISKIYTTNSIFTKSHPLIVTGDYDEI